METRGQQFFNNLLYAQHDKPSLKSAIAAGAVEEPLASPPKAKKAAGCAAALHEVTSTTEKRDRGDRLSHRPN
jgi:hypothetical protein